MIEYLKRTEEMQILSAIGLAMPNVKICFFHGVFLACSFQGNKIAFFILAIFDEFLLLAHSWMASALENGRNGGVGAIFVGETSSKSDNPVARVLFELGHSSSTRGSGGSCLIFFVRCSRVARSATIAARARSVTDCRCESGSGGGGGGCKTRRRRLLIQLGAPSTRRLSATKRQPASSSWGARAQVGRAARRSAVAARRSAVGVGGNAMRK